MDVSDDVQGDCGSGVWTLTSAAVYGTVLPAAVSPQVHVIGVFHRLAAVLLRLIQSNGVLVVNPVRLIVKQKNLPADGITLNSRTFISEELIFGNEIYSFIKKQEADGR